MFIIKGNILFTHVESYKKLSCLSYSNFRIILNIFDFYLFMIGTKILSTRTFKDSLKLSSAFICESRGSISWNAQQQNFKKDLYKNKLIVVQNNEDGWVACPSFKIF